MPVSAPSLEFRSRVVDTFRRLQARICAGLENVEQEHGGVAQFGHDAWTREGGGGGLTRVASDGKFLEKGGVAFSEVHGQLDRTFAEQLPGQGNEFFAAGVSLVLHPRNPYVPTVHANFRYLEHGPRRWFGGGADLTPYYLFDEDVAQFHDVWRQCCERHPDVADHARFRDWCDRYFYIVHRAEHRGAGGIFFDDLELDDGISSRNEALLAFVTDCGEHFLDAYVPIARRRLDTPWNDAQRRWQELRRGRYVEFNLVYDRGTTFGLRTGGRIESILMSLPPSVRWGYCEEPIAGTPEHALLEFVRRPAVSG